MQACAGPCTAANNLQLTLSDEVDAVGSLARRYELLPASTRETSTAVWVLQHNSIKATTRWV